MFRSANQARVKTLVLSFSNTLYAPRARASPRTLVHFHNLPFDPTAAIESHIPSFILHPPVHSTSLHSFKNAPIYNRMPHFTFISLYTLRHSIARFEFPHASLHYFIHFNTPSSLRALVSPRARARAPSSWFTYTIRIHPNGGIESDIPSFIPHSPMHPTSLHSSKNASIYNHMLLFTLIFFSYTSTFLHST